MLSYAVMLLNKLNKQTSRIIIFQNIHKTLSTVKTGQPESAKVTYD
jgi:hypothetical protein